MIDWQRMKSSGPETEYATVGVVAVGGQEAKERMARVEVGQDGCRGERICH